MMNSNKKTGLPHKDLFFISIYVVNYTRVTLPDFKARVETQTFLGLPSTRILTFCKLAFQRRLVEFNACERLLPVEALRPVTKHSLPIIVPPLRNTNTHFYYILR